MIDFLRSAFLNIGAGALFLASLWTAAYLVQLARGLARR